MGGLTFQGDLAELVMIGRKTETRRLLSDNPNSPWYREECGFKAGEHYAVQPGRGKAQIGRVKVLSAERARLDAMTEAEALAEGTAGLRAFQGLWQSINGSYDPATEVWVLRFEPWARYTVCVAGGGTPIVHTYPVEDVCSARAVLRTISARRSWWIVDQLTGRRPEIWELA